MSKRRPDIYLDYRRSSFWEKNGPSVAVVIIGIVITGAFLFFLLLIANG